MKTIKIAVCDDNRQFLDFMQKELLRLSDKQNITFIINLYRDGKEIENLISRQVQTFDILFLDIAIQYLIESGVYQYINRVLE